MTEQMTNPPPPSTPPITDALRAEARANPGGWVYAVDPGFDGAAEVPPQGIAGAWRSDENGALIEEFTPNPRYLPTPQARGWSEPVTPLERVLQLVLSGYLPDERLAREFATSEVFVFRRPDGDGVFVAPAEDGGHLVYAYTDAGKAAATGHDLHRAVQGADLVAEVPDGARIALNAGAHVSALIDPGDVAGA